MATRFFQPLPEITPLVELTKTKIFLSCFFFFFLHYIPLFLWGTTGAGEIIQPRAERPNHRAAV